MISLTYDSLFSIVCVRIFLQKNNPFSYKKISSILHISLQRIINFGVYYNLSNMRVVLADDSGLIRERLTEMLHMYKQAEIVGSLDNGIDTLDSIRTLKPDLAIVDLKMPGLSGLEVVSEIRKEDSHVKIIILTFYSSDFYRNIAIKSGADYFFNKVDDFDEVSMVVAGMLWKEANSVMVKS